VENHIYTWNGISGSSAVSVSSDFYWLGASGTYYYNCLLLTDPVRKIGRTAVNGEVNIAVTNGVATVPQLILDQGSMPREGGYIVRVFRGTSSGMYDKYADIPAIELARLWDDGNALNQFAWQSRTAAGVDAINDNSDAGEALYIDNTVKMGSSLVPTTGTWQAGDIVNNRNPSVDANGMILTKFLRITTGSGNVVGTDWLNVYTSSSSGKVTISEPLITSGSAPSVSVGSGAGTGAGASVSGNNISGTVTLNTGTGTSSGATLFTVTFTSTLTNAPLVRLDPGNDLTVLHIARYFVNSTATTTFVVKCPSGGTALNASSTYLIKYLVVQ
jgi:hypothetical protein